MEYDRHTKSPSIVSINYLNPRESLNHIRRISEDDYYGLHKNSDKHWRLSYLKNQFRSFNLDELFKRYTQRINHGYFSLFLLLQIFLSIVHFLVVLWPNKDRESINIVLPDLVLYGFMALLPIFALYFTDRFVQKYPKLLTIISSVFFVILFIVNFFVPIYHYLNIGHFRLVPIYTTHLIIACYIFFNVTSTVCACVLGSIITLTHITILSTVTYAYLSPTELIRRVASDTVYLLCINMLGVYFRYMNQIVKRRGFLDRRACVESTLKLKFEKEQEEQLMLSIIPKHILEKVREDLLSTIECIERTDRLPREKPFKNPYINAHDNVTILYADIVNYTEMTTKLKPVTKLVETLNELFGRFDDASEELKVLRIKFLGDCYYCVAGLPPESRADHAEACVDLALKMIQIIREVRDRKNLEIDMRIGIHTGRILSGLLGLLKWQFDIWSKDVDIANRMETTGEPGKVHITKQTRELLRKPYNITATQKGETDPYLKQYGIKTFLITPHQDTPSPCAPIVTITNETNHDYENFIVRNIRKSHSETNGFFDKHNNNDKVDDQPQRRDTKYLRRPSGNPNLTHSDRRRSGNPNISSFHGYTVSRRSGSTTTIDRGRERRLTPGEIKRRTAFMDNNINRYQERLRNSDISMQNAIETMPLSKYQQWFKTNDIHPLFLSFRNLKTELKYVKLPDPLFKYYLVIEILVLISVIIIQNLTLTQWAWSAWLCYGTIAFIAIILLPLTWTHFVWNKYFNKFDRNTSPLNPFINFLYETSLKVAASFYLRTVIYVIVCALFVSGVFTELVECSKITTLDCDPVLEFVKRWWFQAQDKELYKCTIPWHMSETASLAVLMSFSFLRIHVAIKFVTGTLITAFYSYCVWIFGERFYEGSETVNYLVMPRTAHIMIIVFLTITLHFIDRQTDYMNRLDFQWSEQLIEDQKKANAMHKINNILLNNILPLHVADIYLNVNRKNTELYHEEYENVAVMFASIVDFQIPDDMSENLVLKYINQIIKDFDTLLGQVQGKPIEKIKVVKWTYMAACGLDPGRRDSDSENPDRSANVVITLLEFAIRIMKEIDKINRELSNTIKLRIGISNGELTAGVIGSKKPLYDIWGNPVNMASRMDSTGIPGKIQVAEATAKIIQQQRIKCEFRGNIKVKGIGDVVPTYFVCLDDKNNFVWEDS